MHSWLYDLSRLVNLGIFTSSHLSVSAHPPTPPPTPSNHRPAANTSSCSKFNFMLKIAITPPCALRPQPRSPRYEWVHSWTEQSPKRHGRLKPGLCSIQRHIVAYVNLEQIDSFTFNCARCCALLPGKRSACYCVILYFDSHVHMELLSLEKAITRQSMRAEKTEELCQKRMRKGQWCNKSGFVTRTSRKVTHSSTILAHRRLASEV